MQEQMSLGSPTGTCGCFYSKGILIDQNKVTIKYQHISFPLNTLLKCNLQCIGLRKNLQLCTPPKHLPRGPGRTVRHHTTAHGWRSSRAWGAVPGRGPTAPLGVSIPAHVEAKPSQARSLPRAARPTLTQRPQPFLPPPGAPPHRTGRAAVGTGRVPSPSPVTGRSLWEALGRAGHPSRPRPRPRPAGGAEGEGALPLRSRPFPPPALGSSAPVREMAATAPASSRADLGRHWFKKLMSSKNTQI